MLLKFLYQGCSVCWLHYDSDLGCDVVGSGIPGHGKPTQRSRRSESVLITGLFSDECLRARYFTAVLRVRGCSERSASLCFSYINISDFSVDNKIT